MSLLYNGALFLWILFTAPFLVGKKKYRGQLLARLGFTLEKIPRPQERRVVWMHAVSLGEMKASLPLLVKLRKEWSDIEIYFSTTTKTAYSQAKGVLGANIDHLFYLPFDFSWIVERYVESLRPDLLLLMETDFWPHLIRAVKKRGGNVVTVNGKISLRSWNRLRRWAGGADWILGSIDLICCQSESYRERFRTLGISEERLSVTGNLKYDAFPVAKMFLNIELPKRLFITIASTHEGEESALLKELSLLPGTVTFLIAPRHPERFARVEEILQALAIPFDKFTEMQEGLDRTTKRVVLINTIGALDNCYALSRLVIVGGSFVPGIGGHNIYEPIRFHKSVLFGPFMHNQEELVKDVLSFQAARQVSLREVKEVVEELLKTPIDPTLLQAFEQHVKGATLRTFTQIEEKLLKSLARKHLP